MCASRLVASIKWAKFFFSTIVGQLVGGSRHYSGFNVSLPRSYVQCTLCTHRYDLYVYIVFSRFYSCNQIRMRNSKLLFLVVMLPFHFFNIFHLIFFFLFVHHIISSNLKHYNVILVNLLVCFLL